MASFIRLAGCFVILGATTAVRAGDGLPEQVASIDLAVPAKDDNRLEALAVSPDGKTLAIGVTRMNFGVQGKVKLYSLPGGKPLRTLEGNKGVAADIAFAPDGKSFAASIGGTVQRWETDSGKELGALKPSRPGPVSHLRFSADGKKLAGVADRIFVVAWDLVKGEEIGLHEPKVSHEPTAISALHLAADGATATALHRGAAQRLDLAGGKSEPVVRTYGNLGPLACTPDGKRVLGELHAADNQSSVVEWDQQTGKEVEFATCPHPPGQLAVSGDGKRIVGTFRDGVVRVWDRLARQEVAAFQAHDKAAFWLALSPDGKTLATGGLDQQVNVWDLSALPEPEKPAIRERPKPVDTPPPTKEGAALAAKAHAVLKAHCYRCHGQDGAAEGGFNFTLDRPRLVETGRVIPGKATKSRLFRRLVADEMPPEDEKVRPSEEEVAVIKKWIAEGAPDWAASNRRKFISLEQVARMVRDDRQDRQKKDPEAHKFLSYLMLTPLYNAGQTDDELQTLRIAFSKLLNSLSKGRRIIVPQAIDEARTVFRVDLRDFEMPPHLWGLAMARNPYGLGLRLRPEDPLTELPVRADWFVHAASRPPAYHELLDIPWKAKDLEARLKVNVADNLFDLKVLRAGFNGSGVSRNNRLIERHEGLHGYYWKSYDFASNIDRQNLFAHPQGPAPGPKTFQHDGGEIIFRLPNGLQAYMLVDDRGNRVDKAPNSIVSDPKHPERSVENGISCMSCHTRGLIDKTDEIRPHIQKNLVSFTPAERESLLALYAPREKFAAVVKADADSFQKAVAETGARTGGTEPIVTASLRFEASLTLRQAAAEVWMTPEDFTDRLEDFPSLARPLGSLLAEGGTIQRDVFVRYFSLAISRFKIAEPIHALRGNEREAPGLFSPAAREVVPLRGTMFAAGFLQTFAPGKPRAFHPVIDPTFRWAAVFEDKGIRILELASGKTVGEVKEQGRSLAFSPDGAALAVGSNDGRARVWNWKTGDLIAETPKQGSGSGVFSLAFSPKGDQLLGVGGPREVHLWDIPSGKLRHVLKPAGTPNRVAFAPDGKTLLACTIARKSGTLVAWDAASGKLRGGGRSADTVLLDVVFSPDSKRFVTLGGNATVRLWDTATCDPIGVDRLATNPDNGRFVLNNITTAFTAAFSRDGKYLAIAYEDGAIALCDGASLRDMTVFQAHEPGGLRTVCFSPDGTRLTSTGADGFIRFWDVRKLVEAERQGDEPVR